MREERKERRELSEENRKLWRDNAPLREERVTYANATKCPHKAKILAFTPPPPAKPPHAKK